MDLTIPLPEEGLKLLTPEEWSAYLLKCLQEKIRTIVHEKDVYHRVVSGAKIF